MRKVILLVMVTLDGFFDGQGEGLEKIDWHHAGLCLAPNGGYLAS